MPLLGHIHSYYFVTPKVVPLFCFSLAPPFFNFSVKVKNFLDKTLKTMHLTYTVGPIYSDLK